MKNKNGFVFVETMIVVVVLVSVLLIIYSSYTALVSYERRLARYDDPAFIYKTKIVADFLLSIKDKTGTDKVITNRLREIVNANKNDSLNEGYKYIVIRPDDTNLFYVADNYVEGTENSRQTFFNNMYSNLNIQMILLINKKNLAEFIENGKEDLFTSDFYRYLKTIDTSKDNPNQFYIAVMYAEKVNGTKCSPNELFEQTNAGTGANASITKSEGSCTFYYSSLKLGEVSE